MPTNNWLDDAFREFQKNGGLQDLPGKGKPLAPAVGEDPLGGILKEAGVLPPWLELQREIRTGIENLVNNLIRLKPEAIDTEIRELNQLIMEYNRSCPSSILQKPLLTQDTLERQKKVWE